MAIIYNRRTHRTGHATGQMTVEFVVMFPAALVIALVAVNACLFFSDCAAFDRSFRSAVCTQAVSAASGQDSAASAAIIASGLQEQFDATYEACEVSARGSDSGLVEFSATLKFYPTLFGMGQLKGLFGVQFPPLSHTSRLSVDVYKPGVIL